MTPQKPHYALVGATPLRTVARLLGLRPTRTLLLEIQRTHPRLAAWVKRTTAIVIPDGSVEDAPRMVLNHLHASPPFSEVEVVILAGRDLAHAYRVPPTQSAFEVFPAPVEHFSPSLGFEDLPPFAVIEFEPPLMGRACSFLAELGVKPPGRGR